MGVCQPYVNSRGLEVVGEWVSVGVEVGGRSRG